MAKILLGISGSIAAFKSILLIRELTAANHECKIILTRGGERFITPHLIAGLGCEVYTDNDLISADPKRAMLHINLARFADIVIIAPASANTIAKLAHGFTDTLLGEVALATTKPLYLAPAMNQAMWAHPALQNNLQLLKSRNYIIWGPEAGIQACGESGIGRMQEVQQLSTLIKAVLQPSPPSQLAKFTLMITLGATIEPLDPVRFISNHSSGKMGIALINAALACGAKVIAIHAQLGQQLPPHPRLTTVFTPQSKDMLENSLKLAPTCDAVIACAAVCDYRPEIISRNKIKKTTNSYQLNLIKNPDIVAAIKQTYPHLVVVGFAAETCNIIENASAKLKSKNLDLVIANDVSNNQVFNQDEITISIIGKNQDIVHLPHMSKSQAAESIISALTQQLESRNQ
jgi:phosphopantothenoylcysteine decarboxylase/phosphopantothenate--cysteine ligase